jgi:shikimate dehydrogenase
VVAGLSQLGCSRLQVVGRDRQKLEQFKQSWQNLPVYDSITVHSWTDLPELISESELLVNTTPVGMYPNVERSPIDRAAIEQLQPGAIAYDLIYTPNPTQFLKLASQQGAIAIDGLEMLVQQGAAALQIWLQQPVPVGVMRQSLKEIFD